MSNQEYGLVPSILVSHCAFNSVVFAAVVIPAAAGASLNACLFATIVVVSADVSSAL